MSVGVRTALLTEPGRGIDGLAHVIQDTSYLILRTRKSDSVRLCGARTVFICIVTVTQTSDTNNSNLIGEISSTSQIEEPSPSSECLWAAGFSLATPAAVYCVVDGCAANMHLKGMMSTPRPTNGSADDRNRDRMRRATMRHFVRLASIIFVLVDSANGFHCCVMRQPCLVPAVVTDILNGVPISCSITHMKPTPFRKTQRECGECAYERKDETPDILLCG